VKKLTRGRRNAEKALAGDAQKWDAFERLMFQVQ